MDSLSPIHPVILHGMSCETVRKRQHNALSRIICSLSVVSADGERMDIESPFEASIQGYMKNAIRIRRLHYKESVYDILVLKILAPEVLKGTVVEVGIERDKETWQVATGKISLEGSIAAFQNATATNSIDSHYLFDGSLRNVVFMETGKRLKSDDGQVTSTNSRPSSKP